MPAVTESLTEEIGYGDSARGCSVHRAEPGRRPAWHTAAHCLVVDSAWPRHGNPVDSARWSILPQLQPIAEALGRVTWALIVCLGLGLGKLLSGDKPFWVGLSGLVSAPIAFTAAQTLQKAAAGLLEVGAAGAGGDAAAEAVIAGLRGIEYAVLGVLLAWVTKLPRRTLAPYLVSALIVGIVFGGLLLTVNNRVVASLADGLVWMINELLFPMGCAIVLFAADGLSKQTR